MSVMLYPCMLCVALLMCLVCFVCCVLDSVCELFGETIRNVCGGALLDRPCMVFQRVCVCCACDPNERQVLLPYVLFVFLYVGSYLLI